MKCGLKVYGRRACAWCSLPEARPQHTLVFTSADSHHGGGQGVEGAPDRIPSGTDATCEHGERMVGGH